MKRRIIDKDNIFMIGVNTWLFATALVIVCYAWYKLYLVQSASGFNPYEIIDFTSPVTLSTIAILFGAFFYSVVIIRPDRAKKAREKELMKLKIKSNQHDAYTDHETGLYNHLSFEKSLHCYLAEFNRIEEIVGLLIVKAENINALEDDTMANIARAIESTARDYDVIARIDTNRFAIITPNIVKSDLSTIADRYRHVMATSETVSSGLRMSIGFACTSPELKTFDALMSAADNNVQVNRRLSNRLDKHVSAADQEASTVLAA